MTDQLQSRLVLPSDHSVENVIASMSRRRFLGLSAGAAVALILAACGTTSSGEEAEKKEISMAFVPSRDTAEIQLSGQKIADFLAKETGYTIKSTTATSYAKSTST